jgi:hypothetical protein
MNTAMAAQSWLQSVLGQAASLQLIGGYQGQRVHVTLQTN